MSVDDMDVLVIGAGLAGLRCAGVLAAAGRDVHVWEASGGVSVELKPDPRPARPSPPSTAARRELPGELEADAAVGVGRR